MSALDDVKKCIEANENFVLQGGAGSGKTELLKQLLEFIYHENPEKKIACITHTNLAAEEIRTRVGDRYTISTIHSFINNLIKNYKKNIHEVIHNLFLLEQIVRNNIEDYNNDQKEQKKEEHKKYKKIYGKYASTLFTVKSTHVDKVTGKREYDKTPETYNESLNSNIRSLNEDIITIIKNKEFDKIKYNDTRFNNFHDLTYGHDGLLDIASILFREYKVIGKILQDKYDYIFIDEYQDTKKNVIDIFLKHLPKKETTLIGLFGDSMQSIYEDGIGDVDEHVDSSILTRINKEDNYRCSVQVIDFINKLRSDGISQEIALKNGEQLSDRQGDVTLYYAIIDDKPHSRSSQVEKDAYIKLLDKLITIATEDDNNYRHLKLTNKSIASDVGFEKLYEIFASRYVDTQEYLERHLLKLQFIDLLEVCSAYKTHDYNTVLSSIKNHGFSLKTLSDKKIIKEKFEKISNSNDGAYKTLNEAFELELLKKSEKHAEYIEEKDRFFEELASNTKYIPFKKSFDKDNKTYTKMKKILLDLDEDSFNELKRMVVKDIFYSDLFSSNLNFKEIFNYFDYLNEKTKYITMHKTKGSGIKNVLVVLDEYFWNEYNFRSVFSTAEENLIRKIRNQKLVYVACSRAISNLKCVKIITSMDEETELKEYFKNIVKIDDLINQK